MQRLIISLLLVNLACGLKAQQPFEGVLRIQAGDNEGSVISAGNFYFAPGRLRIDMKFGTNNFSEIFYADSNFFYLFCPDTAYVQKIIMDSFPDNGNITQKRLSEKKTINSYPCYGIEYTSVTRFPFGDSTYEITNRDICWYAEDLFSMNNPVFIPFTGNLLHNGHICLAAQWALDEDNPDSLLTAMSTTVPEPMALHDSIFRPSPGKEIRTVTFSSLNEQVNSSIKVGSITITDESHEPPPPPPVPAPTEKKKLKKQDE